MGGGGVVIVGAESMISKEIAGIRTFDSRSQGLTCAVCCERIIQKCIALE